MLLHLNGTLNRKLIVQLYLVLEELIGHSLYHIVLRDHHVIVNTEVASEGKCLGCFVLRLYKHQLAQVLFGRMGVWQWRLLGKLRLLGLFVVAPWRLRL